VALVLALAAAGAGTVSLLAAKTVGEAVRNTVRSEPGTPILEVARRLETAFDQVWWGGFFPGPAKHAATLAESIRQGGRSLTDLSTVYDTVRARVNREGLPGRILAGAALTEPVEEKLDAVVYPWHRGTMTYREISAALAPYRQLEFTPVNTIAGRLLGAPVDHALLLTVVDAAGVEQDHTAPLNPSDTFQLALIPDSRIRFTDVLVSTMDLLENWPVPVDRWQDGPIVFPGNKSRFTLRFDPETANRAPALPDLSPIARREILAPER